MVIKGKKKKKKMVKIVKPYYEWSTKRYTYTYVCIKWTDPSMTYL